MCKILAKKGPGQKFFSLMFFFMYWELKFQISAQLKEKSWKIEKIFYGSQMFAENTLWPVYTDLADGQKTKKGTN